MTKKKKAKKAEVKEQKKAPSKKSNAWKYVVGAIVVIIIILALVLLLRQAPQAPTQPTKPAEKPAAPAEAEKPTLVSEKPAELKSCSIDYAIGWPKNKLGQPCTINGKKVTAQLMFSGKGDKLDGMWFYITTSSGAVKYLKDSRAVKQGETLEYTIDVGEKIEDLLALPMSNGKACLNQRLLVVKTESCVTG